MSIEPPGLKRAWEGPPLPVHPSPGSPPAGIFTPFCPGPHLVWSGGLIWGLGLDSVELVPIEVLYSLFARKLLKAGINRGGGKNSYKHSFGGCCVFATVVLRPSI